MPDDRDEDLLAQEDLPRRRGRGGAGKAETGRGTKAEGDTGPYRRLSGQRYADFLADLHQAMTFDWYLEIGCRQGRTFGPVKSNTIAVDPYFRAEQNIINAKRRLFIFQETSDDFFATGFLKQAGITLGFSFLDGMHLFEFLLRDVINTEAQSSPDGVIALHDCIPFKEAMTTRDLDNLPRGPWAGDVWKLIPILQEYRPDLKITVLGARPTGLVLLSNLDPKNTVLKRNYDKILARYTAQSFADFGPERFYDSYQTVDPEAYAAADYPDFAGVRRPADHGFVPVKITP